MPSILAFRLPWAGFQFAHDDPRVVRHYHRCRFNGCSHQFAEMLAHQHAPGLQTDTAWLAGHGDFEVDPDSLYGANLLREARDAGVTTRGKVYKGQLALYPGDPRAWVESRADCVRLAEERGMTLEGGINYKPPQEIETRDLKNSYRVSDSILEEQYLDAIEADPSLAKKSGFKEELCERLSGDAA